MNSRTITTASLLIVFGVLLLFSNLGMLPSFSWLSLISLWPVFLIALGLQLLFPRGPLALLAPLLLIGTVIFGLFYMGPHGPFAERYVERSLPKQTDGHRAHLVVAQDVLSVFQVGAAEDTNAALQAQIPATQIAWRAERRGDVNLFTFSSVRPRRRIAYFPSAIRRPYALRLSPGLAWQLTVRTPLASATIDLRQLNWDQVTVDSGIANLKIVLPAELESTPKIRIASGISRVILQATNKASFRVTSEAPGVLNNYEEAGLRRQANAYYSPEYRADSFVDIIIESGLGYFQVEWI